MKSQIEGAYTKSTFCIYGLYRLHGQFPNFKFFTSLLKALIIVKFSTSTGIISYIWGPRYEMLSLPWKTLWTFDLTNSDGLRYVNCKHCFVLQKPRSLMGPSIYLILQTFIYCKGLNIFDIHWDCSIFI